MILLNVILLRFRKVNIAFQRYRSVVLCTVGLCVAIWLVFDTSIQHSSRYVALLTRTEKSMPVITIPFSIPTTMNTITTTPSFSTFISMRSTKKKHATFHILPKFLATDFSCKDVFYDTGHEFKHTETYLRHLVPFQTAVTNLGVPREAVANELSWILHEIAKNAGIRTVCETGFKAGHNSFQWLTASKNNAVYSFEDDNRFNYTKKMANFMTIEFLSRFFIFFGDTKVIIIKQALDNQLIIILQQNDQMILSYYTAQIHIYISFL